MTIEGDRDIADALASLAASDARLVPVIETAGHVPLRRSAGGLKGLCGIIAAQQVSKASADAIFGRLCGEVDLDDHAAILSLPDEAFRRAGLSRPKQRTLIGLAEATAEGRLVFTRLASVPGPEAVAELVALKGVGVWTAECYLLFCVGHPDVFPVGDLALQAAVAEAFGLGERPKPKELTVIAERWSPHRSTAARLFWAYYGAIAKRDVMPVG